MTKRIGIWNVEAGQPHRVEPSRVALERDLEGWIESHPALLAEGLKIVGRQVHVEAGFIDLLGIDVQGRWVVIELKRERMRREAVVQALDYVACLREMPAGELRSLLESGLGDSPDRAELLEAIDFQLEDEALPRELAIIVAGSGVDRGLDRMVGLLSDKGLSIRVVSFDVWETRDGARLLIRDIVEEGESMESDAPSSPRKTVEDIAAVADTVGVGAAFRRVMEASEKAGLFNRPYVKSVMVAPPDHRNRFLLVLTPQKGRGLRLNHGPEAFAEFFPHLTATEVEEQIGSGGDYWLSGSELDEQVERLCAFFASLEGRIGEISGLLGLGWDSDNDPSVK